jgi:hypothetical protein
MARAAAADRSPPRGPPLAVDPVLDPGDEVLLLPEPPAGELALEAVAQAVAQLAHLGERVAVAPDVEPGAAVEEGLDEQPPRGVPLPLRAYSTDTPCRRPAPSNRSLLSMVYAVDRQTTMLTRVPFTTITRFGVFPSTCLATLGTAIADAFS